MNNVLRKYKFDLLLLATYVLVVFVFKYYYPKACIAWDTNYYLDIAKDLHADIRPIGYSYLLERIYHLRESFTAIIAIQFALFFFAVYSLLVTLRRFFNVGGWLFYLLGVIILAEPAMLYYSNTILSDSFFASLTILYLATLIRYVMQKNRAYLVLHGLLIYCCIEVRFIALYYAFFSVLIFILYIREWRYKIEGGCIALLCFFIAYTANVKRNEAEYGMDVFSAFSGWTQANNAIYALPDVPKTIATDNVALNGLHNYIAGYMDTSSIKVEKITTDYVWSPQSPLNIIRQRVEDSIRFNAPDKLSFALTMFILADRYDEWGKYIQLHYPVAFIKHYIWPNTATLITPEDGEMMDYYMMQKLSSDNWMRYHTTEAEIKCRRDIYKDNINTLNTIYYHVRFALFIIVSLLLLISSMRLKHEYSLLFHVMIIFTAILYAGMLCTSWFIHRYLLPVYPIMTIVCFMGLLMLISKRYRVNTLKPKA
jgi:hypothetical protein